VTGGGGFVGSRLLPALLRRRHSLVALDRSGSIRRALPASEAVQLVDGDLLEPSTYRHALSTADVVVHLAASTGRAREEEHFRVNARGTALLLEQCRELHVQKFLFVSSIAAKFPDTRHYPYARAKAAAEEAVRASGLKFAVIRPTIILGRGSPILTALQKLAMLPLIPVFGDGRTRVQPIAVDDVVEFILAIIEGDLFSNETFDVGGPQAMTMEELLQAIRQSRRGARGRPVRVPLPPLLLLLRVCEAVGVGRFVPVTEGQLSSFRFDGTVTPNPLHERYKTRLKSVWQALSSNAAGEPLRRRIPLPASSIGHECGIFTRYLLNVLPAPYVVAKYEDAHRLLPELSHGTRFDAFLLRVGLAHPTFTKLADSYARIFFPDATLRKKLVVLLAILESSPSYRLIDDTAVGGKTLLLVRSALKGCIGVGCLLAAAVIFSPARLALAVVGRQTR
jgi:NADH dehydrogenase